MAKVKISLGRQLRAFDARLSGAILNPLPLSGPPGVDGTTVYGGSALVACDVGVWRFGFDEKPEEVTQALLLSSGKLRTTYRTHRVNIRRQTTIKGENITVDDSADTVDDVDYQNVLQFGGRALRKLRDMYFYATAIGLFCSEDGVSWRACADGRPDVTDSTADLTVYFAEGKAGAPLGVNDVVALGDDPAQHGYLVATDGGLFLLKLDQGFSWTAIPQLFGTCVHRLVQVDMANPAQVLVCAETGIYEANLNRRPLARAFGSLLVRIDKSFVDLRNTVGPIRQVHLDEATGHLVVVGTNITLLQRDPATGYYDSLSQADLPPLAKLDGGAESKIGARVTFLSNGGLLYAAGNMALLLDDKLNTLGELVFEMGSDTFVDQKLVSVAEPWPGVIAVGSTQGGFQILPLSAVNKALANNWATIDASDRSVWSRDAPLLIDKVIIPGPAILCGPGETIRDNKNPPCAQDGATDAATLRLIEDLIAAGVSYAAAAATLGASLSATLAALWDAMKQLIVIGGVHDAFSAWCAKTFYNYDGHANCVLVPSGPIMAGDQIIDIFPLAAEGSFSGNATYTSVGVSPFGADASTGWARFDRLEEDRHSFDYKGQPVIDILYVHFKNWSDDRTRCARLDLLVSRNQMAGRTTVIIP